MNRAVLAVVALAAAAGLAVAGSFLPLYAMGWERGTEWVGLLSTAWGVESVGLEFPDEMEARKWLGLPIIAGAVLLAASAALLAGRWRRVPARPNPAEGDVVVYEVRPVDPVPDPALDPAPGSVPDLAPDPASDPVPVPAPASAVAPGPVPAAGPVARPGRDGLIRALAFSGAGVLVGAVWAVLTMVADTLEQGRAGDGFEVDWEFGDGVVVLVVACLVAVVGALLAVGGTAARAPGESATPRAGAADDFPGDDAQTPPRGFPAIG